MNGTGTKLEKEEDACPYKQPDKCVACIWGRWEASRQFCMRPVCVREEAVVDANGLERG
ncbi:hypothetical protein [Paenibacillus ginsengarvi]|uniref:hypothetical protein n=1 Tax=Paenibacillus ginsengarvi TaxID=400777 RepID=UPI0013154F87|nr:hypothetical protein [Paenibacillus ginsengarvi]